jgi:hypothetical protein
MQRDKECKMCEKYKGKAKRDRIRNKILRKERKMTYQKSLSYYNQCGWKHLSPQKSEDWCFSQSQYFLVYSVYMSKHEVEENKY